MNVLSSCFSRFHTCGPALVIASLLLTDLMKLGLWNEKMKNAIIAANGSVAGIPEIPDDLKAIYKTVWEISQRKLVRPKTLLFVSGCGLSDWDRFALKKLHFCPMITELETPRLKGGTPRPSDDENV